MDFTTGETHWAIQPRPEEGALILADEWLVVLTGNGELMVGPATPDEWKPILTAQVLEGHSWTSPVVAKGRLYVRNTEGTLKCFNVRP